MNDGWYEAFQRFVQQTIGPPLKSLHTPLDDVLSSLSLNSAKVVVLAFFALAGAWVLSLPRSFVYLGAPDQARWRDLRWWAVIVLIPYGLVYLWMG